MHWMSLFLVVLGLGLLGWLQLIAAGIILLIVALVLWVLDVLRTKEII